MIRPFQALRDRPVPSSAEVSVKKQGYRRDVPIDFSGRLAAEPCIELRSVGIRGENHYNRASNPPYYVAVPGSIPQLYMRSTAAAKLRDANARLAEAGLELYVFDAWRPQAVQGYFHDIWFPNWLRERRPDLSGDALTEEVERYWAAPSDGPNSPSPHATGGAIDLTLMFSDTKQPLFMGGLFDDLTEDAWTDGFERRSSGSMSDEEARANRRLLYWIMTEAGFANNPTEWWHYSWGDQMWARLADQPAAIYGACDPTAPGRDA